MCDVWCDSHKVNCSLQMRVVRSDSKMSNVTARSAVYFGSCLIVYGNNVCKYWDGKSTCCSIFLYELRFCLLFRVCSCHPALLQGHLKCKPLFSCDVICFTFLSHAASCWFGPVLLTPWGAWGSKGFHVIWQINSDNRALGYDPIDYFLWAWEWTVFEEVCCKSGEIRVSLPALGTLL